MGYFVATTTPPSMAVRVGRDVGYPGTVVTAVAAADRVLPRIDAVSVDPAGMVTVATGIAAKIPDLPVLPEGYHLVAYLSVHADCRAVTDYLITMVEMDYG